MNYFIHIGQNDTISLRDPQETELGRKIISKSIDLIDQLGFEAFTFKKLAEEIESTQASVYRYFENKHKLLVYLTSWHWSWLEFQISFNTNNIKDPKEKIKIIIREISYTSKNAPHIPHIDEAALYRIVISESSKAYLIKNIDNEVKNGMFSAYSSLCKRISEAIKELNPQYPYPLTLASNMIETAHEQIYFAEHLPDITDLGSPPKQTNEQIQEYLTHLIEKLVLK